MKYSILTSVYEREDANSLRLSLMSMLNQTIPPDDYVIIADGPLTNELDNVIEDLSKKYKCIQVIRLEKNVGLGRALNIGLEKCKNELIARMDSDDISIENRCELQLKEFEEDKNLDIVGTSIMEFVDNPDNISNIKISPETMDEIYKYGKRRNPFNHPTVMYKRSTILKYGGYSSMRQGQDHELFIRLLSEGCRGKNIKEPLLKFRSNLKMYGRRKSWNSVKSYIKVVYTSFKSGYASILDLLIVVLIQLSLFALPVFFVEIVYKKFLRK